MKRKSKKSLSLLLALMMALTVLTTIPFTARAADTAYIYLNYLGASDAYATPGESYWFYQSFTKTLYLQEPNGEYYLYGSNNDLRISIGAATNANIRMDNASVAVSSGHPSSERPLDITTDCTLTLTGVNTFTSNIGGVSAFIYYDVNLTLAQGGTGGQLKTDNLLMFGNYAINLSLTGNVSINSAQGIQFGGNSISVGPNASIGSTGETGLYCTGAATTLNVEGSAAFYGTTGTGIRAGALYINGAGDVYAEGADNGIRAENLSVGGCNVSVRGGTSYAVSVTENIAMTGDAGLTMYNGHPTSAETHTFSKLSNNDGYRWKLTGAGTSGWLTDKTITASVAANAAGTVEHKAIRMATINVGTLGGTDASNDGNPNESHWRYNSSIKYLYLTDTDGCYTLTGTNSNLGISVGGTSTVTLNGVNISGEYVLYPGSGSVIILVGSNIMNYSNTTTMWLNPDVNVTFTSNSGGSLTLTSNGSTVGLSIGASLNISGNASVTALSNAPGYSGFSTYNENYRIMIGDNAKFSFNNTGGTVTRTFTKASAEDTHRWKLTNASLASGSLTDASVSVSVPAGQTGTVEREVRPIDISLLEGSNSSGLGWSYDNATSTISVTGDITVVGSKEGRINNSALTINIATDKTVTWKAEYSGNGNLIIVGGSGTFNLADGGKIEESGGYYSIQGSNILISGGEIRSSSGCAIGGTSNLNVTGGLIESSGSNPTTQLNGTAVITGGTIRSNGWGGAIEGYGTITVGGAAQIINTANGSAINKTGGNVTVGGSAQISSIVSSAWAIKTSDTVTLTGGTISSAQGTAISAGTLIVSGSGTVTVNGGTSGRVIQTSNNILMSDTATLVMANRSGSAETNTFERSSSGSALRWKLTNATTTNPLTGASIAVTLAAGATGTVQRETSVAPTITGPAAMTLTAGYAAASTGAYTIGGSAPVTVTKTSGNAAITWNDSAKKLDIAAGLPAGVYPVVLTASNGTSPDRSLTFTLTVIKSGPDSITSPVYETEDGLMRGVKDKTALKDFLTEINENELIKVYKGETEITDMETLMGTGMTVKLIVDGETVDEAVLVIRGDIDGDGEVTAADARQILRYSSRLTVLEGPPQSAADIDRDGDITAATARRALRYSSRLTTTL